MYIITFLVWLVYSTAVTFHFFKPWYLWWLDYFFPLFGWIWEPGSNWFIVWILATITKGLVSSQILEKSIIFCAFFIPFVGGAFLVKKSQSVWAMIFAGIFVTCNPFFYDRFADGQLWMYLLFCTMPFWIVGLFRFFSLKQNTLYQYIVLIVLSVVTTAISMHGARFLLVSFLVFFIVYIDYKNIWKYLWKSLVVGIGILLANMYWIVPNILNSDWAASRIQSFGEEDLIVFQNHLWHANNYITTLSLQWYRWEWSRRFIASYGEHNYPFLLFFLLFPIIMCWIIYTLKNGYKSRRKLSLSILLLTILWYILWLWIAWKTLFADITRFLYTYVPFYEAMRESHKRVLLVVIWYAYFGWYGIYAMSKYLTSRYSNALIWISGVLLIIGYTPSLFLLWRQTPVVDYPQERYALREDLLNSIENNDCSWICYDMLVLPRHQYMRLWFVWKVVLNPSENFFYPLRVLQWDNIEIGPIYSQSNNPIKNVITSYIMQWYPLNINKNINDVQFIEYLKNIGIKYILTLKEVDYKEYIFKPNQYITEKENTPMFILYEIK